MYFSLKTGSWAYKKKLFIYLAQLNEERFHYGLMIVSSQNEPLLEDHQKALYSEEELLS